MIIMSEGAGENRPTEAFFDIMIVASGAGIGAGIGYALGTGPLDVLGDIAGTALGAALGGGFSMTMFQLLNSKRDFALDVDAKTAAVCGGMTGLFHGAGVLGRVPYLGSAIGAAGGGLPAAVISGAASGALAGFFLK